MTDVLPDRAEAVVRVFRDAIRLHERFLDAGLPPLVRAADTIARALGAGGRVLTFGNGGSAADSQHFAAELVGRYERERRPLAAVALTSDTSTLTSIGNDYGYEHIFARQIEAIGRAGDVAVAISTSGGSPNVVAGLRTATALGLATIALTGRDGGAVGAAAEIHLNVPDWSTARVQEVHRTILHAICELIERSLEPLNP
jgi:D-sedoheptulose 7-phosphate isomerase